MKIAILGGSFNPPHICHVFLLQYILATTDVDRVWLVPCYQHAFGKTLAPFDQRLAMCRLAVASLRADAVDVLSLERDRQGTRWTIDTVRDLRRLYPDDEFFWVIGSDVLPELPYWKEFDALQSMITFLVMPRTRTSVVPRENVAPPDSAVLSRLRATCRELAAQGVELPNISSSAIRERIKHQQPIDYLVPQAVAQYIAQHNLYRS